MDLRRPDGLASTTANGGSAIYKLAIPDGTAEYELKATLKITASGGTFALYLRASNDALTGPATQGSYYAMEMTPAVTSGGCTMTANHYKRAGGTVTLLASHSFACANGMTVRLVWVPLAPERKPAFAAAGGSSVDPNAKNLKS